MKRYIKITLDEILKKRNMTQKQLAAKAKIRPASISELVNNQRNSINRDYLARICDVLDIDDISDVLTIVERDTGE